MKRVLLIFLSFTLFISVFTSCSAKNANKTSDVVSYSELKKIKNFNIPNSISINRNGKVSIIKKDTRKFAEILKLTDERFGKKAGLLKLMIVYLSAKTDADTVKKPMLTVQFNYSKVQYTKVAGSEGYLKMIFPLMGTGNDRGIYERSSHEYSAPMGGLESPDKLVKFLNEK